MELLCKGFHFIIFSCLVLQTLSTKHKRTLKFHQYAYTEPDTLDNGYQDDTDYNLSTELLWNLLTKYISDDASLNTPNSRTKKLLNEQELEVNRHSHGTTKNPQQQMTIDKNDNAPVFVQDSYSILLPETTPVNSTLLKMKSILREVSPNFKIAKYSLEGPNSDYFKINSSDGVISLSKALDFDRINNYHLTAKAENAADIYSTVQLLINIKDMDTKNPHFIYPLYTASALENHEGNLSTHPEEVKAVDGDIGINETVYYTVSKVYPAEYRNAFSIDGQSGVISLNHKIDREVITLVTVEIKAAQQNNNLKNADALVLITIVDENDNPPQFSQSVYESSLPENSPFGSTALMVSATDMDEGGFHGNYAIMPADTPFQISDLGMITVKNASALDRERVNSIAFQVWAFDAATNGLNSSTLVVLKLLDINDNNPEFHNQPIHFTIPEGDYSKAPLVIVGVVNATDLDEGLNGQITVSSLSEDGDSNFIVQPNGAILAHGFLDREIKDRYVQSVIASDNGTPPRKNLVNVLITILDVNDNPPIFLQHEYFAHIITANTRAGDPVLTVSATDLDIGNNSIISYRFSQPHGDFTVNEISGQISLSTNLSSITTQKVITLKVIATDHGVPALSSAATVYIILKTKDTELGLQFADPSYNFSIFEDETEGTEVGTVKALAGSTNTLVTYNLKTYSGMFSITNRGCIITKAKLDREEQSSYNIIVEAIDSHQPSNTAATVVTVSVNDVNDNFPIFSPLIRTNITCPEDETFLDLGHITATDNDVEHNGFVKYSLENDFIGTFYINSSTGELTNTKALNAETRRNYELKVMAMDCGIPSLSSSIIIHVTVHDVNDNPPVFNEKSIHVTVKENLPPHVILNVSAVDKDTGHNALIFYSFTKASPLFYIGAHSGCISTIHLLDFERSPEHILTVIAYNPEEPQLQTTMTVTVNVEDMNEERPTFQSPTYNKVILGSALIPGSLIVDLNVTRENNAVDQGVHYSITGGNSEGLFVISNSTGHIFLIEDPPKHKKDSHYALTVMARDNEVPSLSASTKVFVALTPSYTEVPVFSADNYRPAPVSDQALPSAVVVQIHAFSNSYLVYNITSGNKKDYFSMDPLTGIIRTKRMLDKKDFPVDLKVQAADFERPNISSNASVHIMIKNENKFAPTFPFTKVEVAMEEGQTFPMFITQLRAFDNDTGKNGILTYKILNGKKDMFSINSSDGKLYAETTFDFEDGLNEYQIVVVAEDNGGSDRKQGYCTVVVHITDINDFKPVFEQADKMLVEENAPIGSIIGKVTAMDRDSGDHAFILYSLYDEDDQFGIDDLRGNIFVKHYLDYETKNKSIVTVTATNNKTTPFYQTNTTVIVEVLDVNDNAPEFSQELYYSELSSDSAVGTLVAVVNATDRDQGDNGLVEYYLLQDSLSTNYFLIDNARHGKLITAGNHLKPGRVNLRLMAKDRGSPSLNSTAPVIINVNKHHKQQCLPEFKPNELSTTVKTKKNDKQLVYKFAAKDSLGKNITYRIVAGNELDHFILDGKTGELWSKYKLNHNMQPSYTLIVVASEAPETQLQDSLPKNMARLKIYVQEDNEAPVFEKQQYEAEIPNSLPYKFPVIRTVAKYPDVNKNGSFIYSFVNQSGDEFGIDEYTGEIFVVSVAGKMGIFYIKVQATDHDGLFAKTIVKITVDDASKDVVELKINQTSDTIEHALPKIIRVLENILHQNVSILDLVSNVTKAKNRNKEDKTSISFQTFDQNNHLMHASQVIRKLKDHMPSLQHKLEKILQRPVDISVSEPPKAAVSQGTIAGIALGVAMACVVLGLIVALIIRKSDTWPTDLFNIVKGAIKNAGSKDKGGGKDNLENGKDPQVSGGVDFDSTPEYPDQVKIEKEEPVGQSSDALDKSKPAPEVTDPEVPVPTPEVPLEKVEHDDKIPVQPDNSKVVEIVPDKSTEEQLEEPVTPVDQNILEVEEGSIENPEPVSIVIVEEQPKDEGDVTEPLDSSKGVPEGIGTEPSLPEPKAEEIKPEEEQLPLKEEEPPYQEEEQPPPREEEQPPPIEEEQPPPIEEEQPTLIEEEQPTLIEEEQPPPIEEEQPAPIEEEQPPPIEEEQPPPIEEEQPTPIEEEQPPPRQEEQPPPRQEEQPPPKEEEQPPTKEEESQDEFVETWESYESDESQTPVIVANKDEKPETPAPSATPLKEKGPEEKNKEIVSEQVTFLDE